MYIELKNINKTFGSYKASDNVSFALPAGSLSAFLGPSGSGKTTLLRIIAGLEAPDSGDIFIDSRRVNDISPAQRGIGFVFQNYALFRYMTVAENIAFGMKIKKMAPHKIKKRIDDLTELIGLKNLENRYPAQLSGGQRQRVAFARAIAPEPKVLLLDEPFAAIDAKIRKELRRWLKQTIKELEITSIFVTHDQDEASEVADEVLIINKGRVEQSGSPLEVYKNPTSSFTARFIGESTLIDNYEIFRGFERQNNFSQALVRPEFISIFKEKERCGLYTVEEGTVKYVTFCGSYLEVFIELHGVILKAVWPVDREALQVREKVGVLIKKIYLIEGKKIREMENAALTADNSVII